MAGFKKLKFGDLALYLELISLILTFFAPNPPVYEADKKFRQLQQLVCFRATSRRSVTNPVVPCPKSVACQACLEGLSHKFCILKSNHPYGGLAKYV